MTHETLSDIGRCAIGSILGVTGGLIPLVQEMHAVLSLVSITLGIVSAIIAIRVGLNSLAKYREEREKKWGLQTSKKEKD